MKKLLIIMVMLLVVSSAEALELKIKQVDSDAALEVVSNQYGATALNFDYTSTANVTSISYIGTGNKTVDYANNKAILYGINKEVLGVGDVLRFSFDSLSYGTTKLELKNLVACNENAARVASSVSYTPITLYYTQEELNKTVLKIIGNSVAGIDANSDGIVDIRDVQVIVNNLAGQSE